MDRELPAEVIRKGKIRKYGTIAAVLIFLLICYYVLRAIITPTLDGAKIRTSIAESGTIEATITASGVVVPEYELIITSPVSSTIEKVFLKSGDSVKTGQSILLLNQELLQISYNKLKDELEVKKNRKQQFSLDMQRKQIDLQASYQIKELQTRFIQSQYDRMKRLYEIGGATQENLERAALNVDIARQELDQLGQQIGNQKESLETALNGLDIEINIQDNKINEICRQMELAQARASRDGIVTWVNENIGSPVNTGDILARVADLSSFNVEASISDIHAGKLKAGGPVKLRIGEKNLDGQIINVRPTVQNGIVTFIVELDNKSDESLRPNIRADVFVVTSYKDNVVRVENGPFYNGLVDQEVFVVKADRAIRRIVDIGVSNFDYVEIKGAIIPGDEVIVSDMKRYRHMDEVKIDRK